jgi:hypothetical protein
VVYSRVSKPRARCTTLRMRKFWRLPRSGAARRPQRGAGPVIRSCAHLWYEGSPAPKSAGPGDVKGET